MGLFDLFKKKPAPAKAPVRPLPRPGGGLAPHPEPKAITKLGPVEKRFSYASWTAPSHYNLLTGLLPHTSPEHVYASEYYKEDFFNFNRRLGASGIDFAA